MEMKVMYHDRCFDGACSASLFTRFHRECLGTAATYRYEGLAHKPGGMFQFGEFSGGENAIVDFKYSNDSRVTWWFDHHESAFMTEQDRAEFERGQADGSQAMRKFFDPHYTSCTGWIAHVAATRFGFDTSGLKELMYWADIVDGAKYESAAAAVGMEEPAMKLTLVLEGAPDGLIPKVIPLLTERTLGEVVEQDFVQAAMGPLMARHRRAMEVIGERAEVERGVMRFDLTDAEVEGYSKFIPYYLYPEATYVVGLSRAGARLKLSVGTNPWTAKPVGELANIAGICSRYGGGGHARVGAVSFASGEEEMARRAAEEIRAELEG